MNGRVRTLTPNEIESFLRRLSSSSSWRRHVACSFQKSNVTSLGFHMQKCLCSKGSTYLTRGAATTSVLRRRAGTINILQRRRCARESRFLEQMCLDGCFDVDILRWKRYIGNGDDETGRVTDNCEYWRREWKGCWTKQLNRPCNLVTRTIDVGWRTFESHKIRELGNILIFTFKTGVEMETLIIYDLSRNSYLLFSSACLRCFKMSSNF